MKIHNFPTPSPPSQSPCSSSTSSITSTISAVSPSHASVPPSHTRCIGLDLLVKAVYHVAGSVIGVPYIQRRVIRRRKPALRFTKPLVSHETSTPFGDTKVQEFVKKQRGRSKVAPSKYQDSVLLSLKPKKRRSSWKA